MRRVLVPRLCGLALLLAFAIPAVASDPPRVERFNPQGTVKKVRQASARFSEAMVPFGDPRLSDPFDVTCPAGVKGRGRWADARNWTYDFEEDLPAGIVCTFRLRPGLSALSGAPVSGAREFSFSTGGPSVLFSIPRQGATRIDEKQAFILLLDAEATEESILANASFSVEGIGEAVGVSIVKGKERKELIESGPARAWVNLPLPVHGRATALEFRRKKDVSADRRIVVLTARQAFPPTAKVSLRWGEGIRTPSGVGTDEAQTLPFQVRPAFTIGFTCDRDHPGAACIPLLPLRLTFSAPVAREYAEKIVLRGPGRKVASPDLPKPDDRNGMFLRGVAFPGPFPEKAAFRVEIPREIRDDAGRAPANLGRFPLEVATDAFPPLAKFAAPFGVVEAGPGSALPLTVRNIEAQAKARMIDVDRRTPDVADEWKRDVLKNIVGAGEAISKRLPQDLKETGERDVERLKVRLRALAPEGEGRIVDWMRRVVRAERNRDASLLREEKETRTFAVPQPLGEKAFEVVGIPLPKPGFYVVEVESANLGRALLGADKPMYVPAAALVTNMAAHLKNGRESSLVWVTALDTGLPVADADVTIRRSDGVSVVWRGKTDAQGIARVLQELPPTAEGGECWPYCGYFVTARKGDDLTFVFSSWNEGIEPWRFRLPHAVPPSPVIAHTVFDRSLFRAGETVHMKHFLRRHGQEGLFTIEDAARPKALLLTHEGSEQRYELPLSWAPDGSAETAWTIPKEAKLGSYGVFMLDRPPGKKGTRTEVGGYRAGDEEYYGPHTLRSGGFRVEEFRVPLMKASVHDPGGPRVAAREVTLDLDVRYLSGGGAGGASVVLRTDVQPRYVSFPEFADYRFAGGKVVEGLDRGEPAIEEFPDEEGGEEGFGEGGEEEGAAAARPGKSGVAARNLVLGAFGTLRTKVSGIPPAQAPRDLVAELEYRDPNGQAQTAAARVPLWPSRVLLGIKPDAWAASKEAFRFSVAAVGLDGKPLKGTAVSVDLFRRTVYSHRKRLLGGLYSYDHVTETKRVAGPICTGTTDSKGLLFCEATSAVSGGVILQASARDGAGNESFATADVWIAGKDEWWFDAADADRIDLIPERKRYEPGETAVFQVRMPFREATALVTVEREGVAETFVRKLSGKSPVVEVPVKPYYAPNVYVSVLCVRGRVGTPAPAATVDLGKPAFKLGIAEISVGWKAHELAVSVTPQRGVYKVREKAKVTIRAVRTAGGGLPKGTEVAIAAVDEGLLELSPNPSWKLLDAMMGRRPYEVETSTVQMQVIGKRHYGLKALPQGGGGGKRSARELFDTLLLWKGRVPLDADGEAQVEIPLNDSLTTFRIAAVAAGGAEFFGTGEASVRTTQDLMILSGLPPLVREDDRFRANFTVRNATGRPLEAKVSAAVSGGAAPGKLPSRTLTLSPGEAKDATWEIRVPPGAEELKWDVSAAAKGAGDRIAVTQRVVPAVPVRTFQATLAQLSAPMTLPVKRPDDAIPGRGGVNVALRARLSEGMGGVIHYMTRYPYTCLEQKVSRAVALRDAGMWKAIASDLPSYLDRDGLAKYFPVMREGSDALTAYILSLAAEAGREIPAAPRNRMLAGLKGFVEGKVVRYESLPTADLAIRKLAALDALSRYGKAEAALLASIAVEPNLWPTSGVIDWANVLLRVEGIPRRDERLAEAEGILRARLNFQGTTMGFSTERTDALWWLMIHADVNAVRAILLLSDRPGWGEDIPRMVRGAIGRQHRGAWGTTVANAWGVLAMEKFSKIYEKVPVAGVTTYSLSGAARSVDWAAAGGEGGHLLPWPAADGSLSVSHRGAGRPWVTVQSLAAVPLKEPFSSGYRIRKTLSAVTRKVPGAWSRGDTVRVSLSIDAQSDMTWVVVNDPIPAGATILGSGFGTDSRLLTRREKREGLAWPAFTERSFEAFRTYYAFVPKGTWTVEYTVRLDNGGTFLLPATRVEALYAPEMFGEIPNPAVEVAP